MTYSNTAPQNPFLFTSFAAQIFRAHNAAHPSANVAVVIKLVFWLVAALSRCGTSLRARRFTQSKACKVVLMTLAIILTVMPGSRAQKKALLSKVFAKAKAAAMAKQERLWAAYLKWRQRKCWMWSGGFMRAAIGRWLAVFSAPRDRKSFDALIPD